MTLICDFCKKPLIKDDNSPMTFGTVVLDLHKDCVPKFVDRIINIGTQPAPQPFVPIPPVTYQPLPENRSRHLPREREHEPHPPQPPPQYEPESERKSWIRKIFGGGDPEQNERRKKILKKTASEVKSAAERIADNFAGEYDELSNMASQGKDRWGE